MTPFVPSHALLTSVFPNDKATVSCTWTSHSKIEERELPLFFSEAIFINLHKMGPGIRSVVMLKVYILWGLWVGGVKVKVYQQWTRAMFELISCSYVWIYATVEFILNWFWHFCRDRSVLIDSKNSFICAGRATWSWQFHILGKIP